VINPALAPRTVVAINSPEPTIEAERINPGPKKVNILRRLVGGFWIFCKFISGNL